MCKLHNYEETTPSMCISLVQWIMRTAWGTILIKYKAIIKIKQILLLGLLAKQERVV